MRSRLIALAVPLFSLTACSAQSDAPPDGAPAAQAAARPAFRMPFICDQTWVGNNWNGHSPAHSIDWNHYDANGNPDDFGRRVLASAGGTVLESYYSTGSGYGRSSGGYYGGGSGWGWGK